MPRYNQKCKYVKRTISLWNQRFTANYGVMDFLSDSIIPVLLSFCIYIWLAKTNFFIQYLA